MFPKLGVRYYRKWPKPWQMSDISWYRSLNYTFTTRQPLNLFLLIVPSFFLLSYQISWRIWIVKTTVQGLSLHILIHLVINLRRWHPVTHVSKKLRVFSRGRAACTAGNFIAKFYELFIAIMILSTGIYSYLWRKLKHVFSLIFIIYGCLLEQ